MTIANWFDFIFPSCHSDADGVSTKAAPLSAIVMNEGNPHDQAHDTGYIDWIRSAQYIVVTYMKVAHFVHQVVQSGSHALEMAK